MPRSRSAQINDSACCQKLIFQVPLITKNLPKIMTDVFELGSFQLNCTLKPFLWAQNTTLYRK